MGGVAFAGIVKAAIMRCNIMPSPAAAVQHGAFACDESSMASDAGLI
jgi:hypothetical protein